jgi:hypothetical protein
VGGSLGGSLVLGIWMSSQDMDRRSMTESEHCKQGRVFSIENMNDVDTLLVSGVDVNVDVDSRRMAER